MSMEIVLKEAMRLYSSGNLDESEHLFREILENDPQNGDTLYFLGIIAMTRGIYSEALDFLYKATVLYPDNKDYTYSLAVALQETGHLEEAVRIYEKIPELPESQNNLGNLYRTQGNDEKAEAAFDKALEQAYDAYNNVLKDIAKGTGSMNPYTETDGMFDMPTNPSKK